jgi:hypothetical protein
LYLLEEELVTCIPFWWPLLIFARKFILVQKHVNQFLYSPAIVSRGVGLSYQQNYHYIHENPLSRIAPLVTRLVLA